MAEYVHHMSDDEQAKYLVVQARHSAVQRELEREAATLKPTLKPGYHALSPSADVSLTISQRAAAEATVLRRERGRQARAKQHEGGRKMIHSPGTCTVCDAEHWMTQNQEETEVAITGRESNTQAAVEAELDKRLAARETDRQLRAYDALGDDTYELNTVFRVTLDRDGESHTFAAIKLKSKGGKEFWHLTDGSHITWDQLKRMLIKCNPVPALDFLVSAQPAGFQVPNPLTDDK